MVIHSKVKSMNLGYIACVFFVVLRVKYLLNRKDMFTGNSALP